MAGQHGGSNHGATAHRFGTNLDGGQPRHSPWVDDHGRARQAHVQQRHQALPTTDDRGIFTVLGEQRQHLVDGLGIVVLERRRLHVAMIAL